MPEPRPEVIDFKLESFKEEISRIITKLKSDNGTIAAIEDVRDLKNPERESWESYKSLLEEMSKILETLDMLRLNEIKTAEQNKLQALLERAENLLIVVNDDKDKVKNKNKSRFEFMAWLNTRLEVIIRNITFLLSEEVVATDLNDMLIEIQPEKELLAA
jgi:hypothetical protein